MKLFNLTDEILFDCLPRTPRKVFITHLQWLAQSDFAVPNGWPTIYTSKTFATQITIFFKQMQLKKMPVIIRLKAYQPHRISLGNGQQIEVLLCEASTVSRNCMIIVREPAGDDVERQQRCVHFYAGVSTDIRILMTNRQATTWLKEGVDHLYLHLPSDTAAAEQSGERELMAHKISKFLRSKAMNLKIVVVLPLFGCEDLIAFLAAELRKRVILTENLQRYYVNLHDTTSFSDNFVDARVIISHTSDIARVLKQIDPSTIVLHIQSNNEEPDETVADFSMAYCPLPMASELFLLSSLLQSDVPMRIHNMSNRRSLPAYLMQFASPTTKAAHKRKAISPHDSPSVGGRPSKRLCPTSPLSSRSKTVAPQDSNAAASPSTGRANAQTVLAPRKRHIQYLDDSDE